MRAKVLPLFRCQRFQQSQICLANNTLLDDISPRIAFVIMQRGGPCVLIVGLNVDARCPENRTHPPANHNLNVCQMSKYLRDGPFVRRWAFAQLRRAHALDQALQLLRRRCLHLDRVLTLRVSKYALFVLFNRFVHHDFSFPTVLVGGLLAASTAIHSRAHIQTPDESTCLRRTA